MTLMRDAIKRLRAVQKRQENLRVISREVIYSFFQTIDSMGSGQSGFESELMIATWKKQPNFDFCNISYICMKIELRVMAR